jgi:hypothetical protein
MTTADTGEYRENSATARAALARRRAHELKLRRQELARGVPASALSAEYAHQRAEESRLRAFDAHLAAAARHREAGEAHVVAAAMHEQAAMLAGDGNGETHLDAAERHRHEARIHEAAARRMDVVAAEETC